MPSTAGRADRVSAPRFGLRFDRGRAQLVLGEPLELGPLRLESLVTELTVAKGRVSLTEGWRAFRHRQTTLIEARLSIGLGDLARALGEALGGASDADVALIGAPAGLGIAVRTPVHSVAADVAWGWDDADLLCVLQGARALPRGPRGAIAAAHDLAASLSLGFDATRGAVRLADPLRRALFEALLPVGVRVPSTRGIARAVRVEGGRLVLTAGDSIAGAEPARDQLEAARTLAPATAALIDGDLTRARRLAGEHTSAGGSTVRARATAHAIEAGEAPALGPPSAGEELAGLAAELTRALEDRPIDAARVSTAALGYARAEPHGGVASDALVLAASVLADAHRGAASALARAASRRLPIDRAIGPIDVALLARAIELSALEAPAPSDRAAWEPIVRALSERVGTDRGDVALLRAHALALEHAGRLADALTAFRSVLRREDDEASATGLARVLGQLGRWDESLSAWDRVATLRASAGQEGRAREARLRAASAAEHGGLIEAAIARLEAAVEDAPPDLSALDGTSALAARLASVGRASEAAALDRRLPAIVDALGPAFAIEGQAALTAAVHRSIARGDDTAAHAALDALARLVPGSAELGALTTAIEAASSMRLTEGGPAALRARADALRAEGRTGDAARVLIELFAVTSDGAVLRAAVELAERSGDPATRVRVLDRALEVLPAGAARDAIALRRRS